MTFWNLKNDAENPEDGVLDIDGEIVADAGWWTPDGVCVARTSGRRWTGCGT